MSDWQILLKELSCPAATKNIELNTKNRDDAIKSDKIKYGPLNIDEPADYYEKLAAYWDTSVEAAKKLKCSNCMAFDISPRIERLYASCRYKRRIRILLDARFQMS